MIAITNPDLFAATVAARQIALTPHQAVVLDRATPAILVNVPDLLALS